MTRNSLAVAWLLLISILASGCRSFAIDGGDVPRPTMRSGWNALPVQDRRGEFQGIFCRHYRADAAQWNEACMDWIHLPAAGEGETWDAGDDPVPESRSLVVIPGIFGECVAPWVTPYSADYTHLEKVGYRVSVIPVRGRASASENARIIHEFFLENRDYLKDAVVLAYSKGMTDFMLAATQPQARVWVREVDALVSVTGTINGSPIANRAGSLYGHLLARLPIPHCEPADGGGVDSLTYRHAIPVADAFVASRPPFPTYTVAAVSDSRSVNPALAPFHSILAGLDTRNDGQVLLEDAILPGSVVLGIFKADHWAIALPFSESHAWQMHALKGNNRFPRRALIGSILEAIAPLAAHRTAYTELRPPVEDEHD